MHRRQKVIDAGCREPSMTSFASVDLSVEGKHHDHIIDFLRGVAALTVFASHSDQGGLLKFQFITDHKIFLGRFGVYLFFILSGYLIWRSAERTLTKPRGVAVYAVHRFTRIVPLYLVNIAFVVFLLDHVGSAFHPIITTEAVYRHLIFSQSLIPSVSRNLNPVLWTLTHEAIYYTIVPILILLRAPRWALIVAAAVFLLLDKFGFRSILLPFLTLFYLFVLGILVAGRNPLGALIGTVLLLIVLRFSARADSIEFIPSISAAAMFLLIWPAFAFCARMRGFIWLTRPVCWAGVVSYSLYIWHYLLVNIVGTESHFRSMYAVFGIFWVNDYSRAFIFTGLVLLVSTLSYVLIELPSMTSLRRRLVDVASRASQKVPA
jgi:exopolysaccharide production protein ExoZ